MASWSSAQVTSMSVLGLPVINISGAGLVGNAEVVRPDPFSPAATEDPFAVPQQGPFALTTIQVGSGEMDGLPGNRWGAGFGIPIRSSLVATAAYLTDGSGEGFEMGFHGLIPPDLTVETFSKGGNPYNFFIHGPSSRPFLRPANTRLGGPPQLSPEVQAAPALGSDGYTSSGVWILHPDH